MAHVFSIAEREAFLAEVRVAVVAIAARDRGPLAVPVWYAYAPGGEIGLWMDGASAKVRELRREGRLTLCVQDATRPYRYVSVEGPVTGIAPIDVERELRPLIARYLGADAVEAYLAGFGGADGVRGDVWVRVAPAHWRAEQL
ncbi:MAG TPA: pyridoxamine 5'-phosphate oxidase family protein [Gammaproteobacteria bacterium]|nr:pyridoxamine 5'-phosphate oxidase family protein [Gammaproteobacteria bacterium]